jgi:hypothetical protein
VRPLGLAAGVLAVALWGPVALAQTESYEASSGLIPVGGFVIFFNASGPLSYATPTPKDLPAGALRLGVVTGRSCQFGVSTPFTSVSGVPRLSGAAGEGGFAKALDDIRARHPDLTGIYDVKVDDHVVGVLTIFQRQCTEITARGFR